MPASDGAIQLRAHAKVHQFDFGIVGKEDVLALNVAVDNFIAMQMVESFEDLPANVGDPFLLQTAALGGLDEVRHRARAAIFHHQLGGEKKRKNINTGQQQSWPLSLSLKRTHTFNRLIQ